ncbi:hypothetical protein C8A00DRAFT_13037 [Chaetomidium leptoderma]|uniref:Uncharacterized protein n=1 Tax=Chaetomidium leptoderma TaxID=669021 RepID=A0AAN6VRB1_9PEZI|nr:hypothetical protein C8A00DRAFT_13037 [Chaetomidium leptoderma]
MFTLKTFIAAGGLAAIAQAHMLLRVPAPYPGIINSPLEADGSNYPCHLKTTGGAPTQMAKGSKQEMAFTGSAVHGGGSCQVSLTYDKAVTKSSAFKVIHSIQGGCPARNTTANLEPLVDTLEGPDRYEFTIPEDVPSGAATLAWSWVNKIGNREFYMSCAPIEITGSGGSEAALAALPDMFVANIPSVGGSCATPDSTDIEYPNPGKSVDNFSSGTLTPPTGECGGAAGAGAGGSGGAASAAPGGAAATPPAVRGRRASFRA